MQAGGAEETRATIEMEEPAALLVATRAGKSDLKMTEAREVPQDFWAFFAPTVLTLSHLAAYVVVGGAYDPRVIAAIVAGATAAMAEMAVEHQNTDTPSLVHTPATSPYPEWSPEGETASVAMARLAEALASAAAEMAKTSAAAWEAQQEVSAMPLAYHLDRIASHNTFVVLIAPVLAEAAVLRFPQCSLNFSTFKFQYPQAGRTSHWLPPPFLRKSIRTIPEGVK